MFDPRQLFPEHESVEDEQDPVQFAEKYAAIARERGWSADEVGEILCPKCSARVAR